MAQKPAAAPKPAVRFLTPLLDLIPMIDFQAEPTRGPRALDTLRWGNVGRLFGGQTADVPPEFEIADLKLKELHQLITDLQKLVKRMLKSLVGTIPLYNLCSLV